MIWLLLGACATQDEEISRLEARLAALEARVEEVEARPTLDADALLKEADRLLRDVEPGAPEEQTAPAGVPLAIFDDLDALGSMGRAIVHIGPEGTPDGFRLSAIRAGSLPARAGLRNGDVVKAVNGLPLHSLEATLAAWETVKAGNPTELTLTLTRRGDPVELTIPVLPPGTDVDP